MYWIDVISYLIFTGSLIGQLKFSCLMESHKLIKEIEASCRDKWPLDNLYVLFKEQGNEGNYVGRRWNKYELITRRSDVSTLVAALNYWWSVTDTTWIKLGFGFGGIVLLGSLLLGWRNDTVIKMTPIGVPKLPIQTPRPLFIFCFLKW